MSSNGLRFDTLSGVSMDVLVRAFNRAFENYFVPMHLSVEQLSQKLAAEGFHPEFSVGAFDSNELVGFVLHSCDNHDGEKLVYNGGTGVSPEYRGQGLTYQMYQFIIPQLKDAGVSAILLEVMEQNVPAIATYKKVGFKTVRRLEMYFGQVNVQATPEVEVRSSKNLHWSAVKSYWDIEPSWQHGTYVIDRLEGKLVILEAFIAKQRVGYLVFNPANRRIMQIATDKHFRGRGVAGSLIGCLLQDGDSSLSVLNLDDRSRASVNFFKTIGMESRLAQWEMRFDIE